MADKIYKVRDPQGNMREISGPAGASDEEIIAQAQKLFSAQKRDIAAEIANDPISQGAQNVINATPAELIAGNPVTRFALGAADPIMGATQFVRNVFSDTANAGISALGGKEKTLGRMDLSQLQGIVNRGREAYGSDGFDAYRTAGNVASPASLMAMKLAPAATAAGRIGQGAGIGAAAGGAAPVTEEGSYFGQKAAQVGAGAALGGAVTGGIEAARGIYNVGKSALEPAFAKGREAILNRYQQALAGDKKQQMVQALRNAPEIVPGSQPTAGEAMAAIPESTGLAAHQRAVSQYVTPEGDATASAAFSRRLADQQGARADMIGQGAKTPQDLAAAISQRGVNADANYSAAFAQRVNADPELAKIAQNPYFKDAIPDALKLADARKISPKTDLTEFMHLVKISLDKQVGKTGDAALANTERAEANAVKSALMGWLEKKNPAYEDARAAFADQSKPINNMQIMQELSRKLQGPSGKETPDVFLRAVDDRTPEAASKIIKKTTGFDRFDKLSDALTPQNAQRVDAVAKDLERTMQFQRNAADSNVTATGIAKNQESQGPRMLNLTATITNWVMKKLGEGADEKIVKIAAERYLNPKQLADALEAAKASPQMMRAQKLINPAIGITAFESARGMQP